jgi:hypothetical protein
MKYIKRKHYLTKIEPFIGKNIIKVITGQRRVGKSYFLFQLMDYIKEKTPDAHIIYINKEYNEFIEIKNHTDLIEYATLNKKDKAKNYLIVDEIQDIIEFERALRHFQAKNDMEIFCTGSNANLLSGELATFLSGRFIELRMYSLSYPEFLNFHNLSDNNQSLNTYFDFGGLPYLINLKPEKDVVHDYLKNIYHTILYKDIIARWNIRNTFFLENLVTYLAQNTGNIISASRISKFLKSQQINMSTQLVLNYLNYLQQAFFIFGVKRAGIEGRKVFEVGEKYYFEDIGIRNILSGFGQQHINQILENIVYIHLKIAGYEVTVGQLGNKEIDFVAEKNGNRTYIQVAYIIADQKVHKREFGNLIAIKDNYSKIVVSVDEFTNDYQGCQHINIRKFLIEIL